MSDTIIFITFLRSEKKIPSRDMQYMEANKTLALCVSGYTGLRAPDSLDPTQARASGAYGVRVFEAMQTLHIVKLGRRVYPGQVHC